jgi:hypothetical protein
MNQSIPLASDARERFLLELAAVVPPHRIAEVHFFPPLRQGPIETGVAVLAALPVGATDVTSDEPDAELVEGARMSSRHVVYSARYRWTRKGPERGKWECEVVAEADAPLLTVETVVEGVRKRANEPLEIERVEGDVIRARITEAQRRWTTTP